MKLEINSLRPFIGAKDYDVSRAFYRDLGFEEIVISNELSLFTADKFSFYLQNYYQKDWIENTMLFLEVRNVDITFQNLQASALDKKYEGVKLIPIRKEAWGAECFMLDPAGVLIHFGSFYVS
jgi:catechol 2,3-dioxygenase-like lactoylglutathione lyase family enzyme